MPIQWKPINADDVEPTTEQLTSWRPPTLSEIQAREKTSQQIIDNLLGGKPVGGFTFDPKRYTEEGEKIYPKRSGWKKTMDFGGLVVAQSEKNLADAWNFTTEFIVRESPSVLLGDRDNDMLQGALEAISQTPEEEAVTKKFEIGQEKVDRWVREYKFEYDYMKEKGSIIQDNMFFLPNLTQKAVEATEMMVEANQPDWYKDKDWENMSLQQKFSSEGIMKTLYATSNGLLASLATMLVTRGATGGTLLGTSIIGASTAEDIKNSAILHGVDRSEANRLGLAGGLPVMLLEKLGWDNILGNTLLKKWGVSFFSKILGKRVGAGVSGTLTATAIETATEVTQEEVQMFAESAFRDIGLDERKTRDIMAGFGGFLNGLFVGGGTISFNTMTANPDGIQTMTTEQIISHEMNSKPALRQMVDTGMDRSFEGEVLSDDFANGVIDDVEIQVGYYNGKHKVEVMENFEALRNQKYRSLRDLVHAVNQSLPKRVDLASRKLYVEQAFQRAIVLSDESDPDVIAGAFVKGEEDSKVLGVQIKKAPTVYAPNPNALPVSKIMDVPRPQQAELEDMAVQNSVPAVIQGIQMADAIVGDNTTTEEYQAYIRDHKLEGLEFKKEMVDAKMLMKMNQDNKSKDKYSDSPILAVDHNGQVISGYNILVDTVQAGNTKVAVYASKPIEGADLSQYPRTAMEESKMAQLDYTREQEARQRNEQEVQLEQEIEGARKALEELVYTDSQRELDYQNFKKLAKKKPAVLDASTDFEGMRIMFKDENLDQSIANSATDVTNDELLDMFKERFNTEMELRELSKQKTPSELAKLQTIKAEKVIRKATVRGEKEKQKVIKMTEKTALKNKLRTLLRGIREGQKMTKEQIKEVQSKLVAIIKESGIEAKDQAKFLSVVKNTQTQAQLAKLLPKLEQRLGDLTDTKLKNQLDKQIKRELKGIKPKKIGSKRVAKYSYEENKFLESIRSMNGYNQEKAQEELEKLPTEGLTEQEVISARFLSLKANGKQSSVQLYDSVLADIQTIKAIGEQSKSEEDFNKKLERAKEVDKVSKEIDRMKGDQDSLITKMENTYRLGFTNIYSIMNSIVGKKLAKELDPTVSENRKDTAIYYKTREIIDNAKRIFGSDSNHDMTKRINDMAEAKHKIIDSGGRSIDISTMELIDMYNSVKNELLNERYDNEFGADQVNSLLANMTVEETNFADMLMDTVQEYKDVLNDRTIEITGRDMGSVDNYWMATSKTKPDFYDDIKMQGETVGATKNRVMNAKVVPVPTNAWIKSLKHITEAEHVNHLSRSYENLKRTFSDENVKYQIVEKFGQKVYDSMMNHIEYISLNKTIQQTDAIANVYGKALNNWVRAKIASPTIFVRQLGSILNYTEDMKTGEWGKYFVKGISSPQATFEFMWENVPFLRARYNRGFNEAMKEAMTGANGLKQNMGSFANAITSLTRSGDVTAIIYGGYPVIQAELVKGKSMQEAVDEFERRTLQAQQYGGSTGLSHFQNQPNAFAKTLLRFKNTLNQYLRKQADAVISYRNKDISAGHLAKTTAIYTVLNPMLYVSLGWAVNTAFKGAFGAYDPDDDEIREDIMMQLAINPFQAIPILDGISEYVYRRLRGRKTYGVFSTPMLDEVETAFFKISKQEPTFLDIIEALSALQEPVTGIPTQTILRYYKYTQPDSGKSKKGKATDDDEIIRARFNMN